VQLLCPSLARPRARFDSTRLPTPGAAPSFARAGGYEVLDRPFGERLRVVHSDPGDAELGTRLTLARRAAPVLVHWEVARDAHFRELERYGLFFAHAHLGYEVRVALTGLSPGRGYWARLWAGGTWSPSVRLYSGSYFRRRTDESRASNAVGFVFARAASVNLVRPLVGRVGGVRDATPRSVRAPRVTQAPGDL
jgi:hypothetical protein